MIVALTVGSNVHGYKWVSMETVLERGPRRLAVKLVYWWN